MLTKSQLEDAGKCSRIPCKQCSMYTEFDRDIFCQSLLAETAIHYLTLSEQLEAELSSMGQMMADANRVDDENEELRKRVERQAKVLEQAKEALKYVSEGAKHESCKYTDGDPNPCWHCCDWNEGVEKINEALTAIEEVSHE